MLSRLKKGGEHVILMHMNTNHFDAFSDVNPSEKNPAKIAERRDLQGIDGNAAGSMPVSFVHGEETDA